uniref:Uncharacterized protein n=1 Tax=Meloidogyne floridensis TaxID=298350 RepID=A0A915NVZ4_9BILA
MECYQDFTAINEKVKKNSKGKEASSSTGPVFANFLPRCGFSLLELTFLTEILREIEFNTIFTNDSIELRDIIHHHGQLVFSRVYHLQVNSDQILRFYYNILHAKQQTSVEIIPNSTKNMFIIWHLFGIARNLIRSFLLNYSQNKAMYDGIFSQRQKLISVISYIRAFDYLELKAKNWMGFLRGEQALRGENITFSHDLLPYSN